MKSVPTLNRVHEIILDPIDDQSSSTMCDDVIKMTEQVFFSLSFLTHSHKIRWKSFSLPLSLSLSLLSLSLPPSKDTNETREKSESVKNQRKKVGKWVFWGLFRPSWPSIEKRGMHPNQPSSNCRPHCILPSFVSPLLDRRSHLGRGCLFFLRVFLYWEGKYLNSCLPRCMGKL